MDKPEGRPTPDRKYPELYERVVPIALVVIAVAIAVLLLIIVAVVLRVIP